MNIEVSRNVTRRVRGLHLAVLSHNRTGQYHGNGMLTPQAVALAKAGAYGRARTLLRDMRSNGRDRRMSEFADVAVYAGGVHNEGQRKKAQTLTRKVSLNKAYGHIGIRCPDAVTKAVNEHMSKQPCQQKKLYRFTHAAANRLRLHGRETTKFVEVGLSVGQVADLRDEIDTIGKTQDISANERKTLQAAFNVLD